MTPIFGAVHLFAANCSEVDSDENAGVQFECSIGNRWDTNSEIIILNAGKESK